MSEPLNLADLIVGPDEPLASSDWIDVSQNTIDRFAEATGDHQWIHVDPARAARESPFHTTIAHGFLTLSLVSRMAADSLAVAGVRMAVNCGLNRVRFTAPVPAGSRVRGRFAVANIEPFNGAVQITWKVTIEREGSDRPCCVAEWLVRYYN